MAKTNCRGPSSLHHSDDSSLSPPPHPVRHSLRPRRRRSPPGIVAFLATLSAAPFSVHAHPLDPPQTALPFLYPPFVAHPTPPVAKRSFPSPRSDATTSTPPSQPPTKCTKEMPDKYAMGDDGFWHKTKWTLNGWAQCPDSCAPASSTDQNADTLEDPNVTDLSSGTSNDNFDKSTLPTGWDIPDGATRHGTVLILSLSVALAIIIIALMISCVIWRRKLIPKKDPEKKSRRSSDMINADASRSIREAKAAQRRWTKAVSLWRTNARFSFHRRRTDRAIARTATLSTLGQEGEGMLSEPGNSPSSSRSPSPAPTLRSQASTNQDAPPSSAVSVHSATSRQSLRVPSPEPQLSSPYSAPPHPTSPIEPPAYHSQLPVPSPPSAADHSPPYTHSDSSQSGPSKLPLSSSSSHQPNDGDDGHLGSLSGHVATDDKTLLSRRAALASSPSGSSAEVPPSAPSLEDDDTLEFSSESRPSSPFLNADDSDQRPPYLPPSSLLPPPPSIGKLKYEYSGELDLGLNYDIANFEPGLGPSAPPFEESEAVPSAPPVDLEVDVPVPSAPAMATETEDDRQWDVHRMDEGAVTALPGNV